MSNALVFRKTWTDQTSKVSMSTFLLEDISQTEFQQPPDSSAACPAAVMNCGPGLAPQPMCNASVAPQHVGGVLYISDIPDSRHE
jgi:hypothetical protein